MAHGDVSWVENGRFLHSLAGWTQVGGPTYVAGDGSEHYGIARLPQNAYIEQPFAVPHVRTYTLHLALKGAAALACTITILDGSGNVVASWSPDATVTAWTEYTQDFGLAPGTTYTLRIKNTSAGAGDINVDDVWLWNVPITRANVASRVHAKLARLATERGLSTAASGNLTEGSYTYAIDAGLRAVGAINPETDNPDVRYLTEAMVDTLMDAVELEMLERLQRDYAVEVDISVGPRRESFGQVADHLGSILGKAGQAGGGGGGKVTVRSLTHETPVETKGSGYVR